jgi:hypothetical protein
MDTDSAPPRTVNLSLRPEVTRALDQFARAQFLSRSAAATTLLARSPELAEYLVDDSADVGGASDGSHEPHDTGDAAA